MDTERATKVLHQSYGRPILWSMVDFEEYLLRVNNIRYYIPRSNGAPSNSATSIHKGFYHCRSTRDIHYIYIYIDLYDAH